MIARRHREERAWREGCGSTRLGCYACGCECRVTAHLTLVLVCGHGYAQVGQGGDRLTGQSDGT